MNLTKLTELMNQCSPQEAIELFKGKVYALAQGQSKDTNEVKAVVTKFAKYAIQLEKYNLLTPIADVLDGLEESEWVELIEKSNYQTCLKYRNYPRTEKTIAAIYNRLDYLALLKKGCPLAEAAAQHDNQPFDEDLKQFCKVSVKANKYLVVIVHPKYKHLFKCNEMMLTKKGLSYLKEVIFKCEELEFETFKMVLELNHKVINAIQNEIDLDGFNRAVQTIEAVECSTIVVANNQNKKFKTLLSECSIAHRIVDGNKIYLPVDYVSKINDSLCNRNVAGDYMAENCKVFFCPQTLTVKVNMNLGCLKANGSYDTLDKLTDDLNTYIVKNNDYDW